MAKFLRFALVALAVSAAAQAGAAQPSTAVRLVALLGKDGNVTYYRVACTNGLAGTLTVEGDPPTTCAQGVGKHKKCSTNWSVALAAQAVCR